MKTNATALDRRDFIKKSSFLPFGLNGMWLMSQARFDAHSINADNINIFGHREGFSPQIGILVSMLDWMRAEILLPIQGLSMEDLDYLLDESANSIGSMLLHLAATERFYQLHTFENKKWGNWDKTDKDEWSIASSLGAKARESIKGNDLDFYLDKLKTVRENTMKELADRDDDWLMKVDPHWYWGPTNNYCKWFHVCEHESNHGGQIKFLVNRLPRD